MAKDAYDKLTIDQKMDKLDEIIENMESEEITLEESFNLYKEGVGLLSSCNEAIDRVEKEVLKLSESGEAEPLEDYK